MNKFVPLRRHQRERGLTAIEFAILFPVFFSILYAIIQYGMIFAAQQTLTLAAEEGARAALQYQAYVYTSSPCSSSATSTAISTTAQALTARQCVAQNTCQGLVSWVGQVTSTPVATICSATQPSSCPVSSMDCVQVTTTLTKPLIPTLPLLSWAVPSTLTNTAIVQIDPANVI
jgi:Flp pilus assembly protein TadG